MKEIPFGIEYVKNVVITEVNLGLSSEVDANKITINQQEEVPYHGFVTCKYCGKSTSTPRKAQFDDRFKLHYGYCKNRDSLYLGKSDAVFEEALPTGAAVADEAEVVGFVVGEAPVAGFFNHQKAVVKGEWEADAEVADGEVDSLFEEGDGE